MTLQDGERPAAGGDVPQADVVADGIAGQEATVRAEDGDAEIVMLHPAGRAVLGPRQGQPLRAGVGVENAGRRAVVEVEQGDDLLAVRSKYGPVELDLVQFARLRPRQQSVQLSPSRRVPDAALAAFHDRQQSPTVWAKRG